MGNWSSLPLPISAEDAKTAADVLKNQGIGHFVTHLKDSVKAWKATKVEVGVIGYSGTGKSTFINAIRGLRAEDRGAAAVGIVETTMKPESYPHPQNRNLRLWDLPGVGTPKFPRDKYLNDIDFEKYDCFIVIIANRISEYDTWLANEISETSRKVYFVRTKFQIDLENDKTDHGNRNEEVLIKKLRRDMKKQLNDEAPVYVIDSHHPNKYDFSVLLEAVIAEIPSKKKQEAATLTLTAWSQKMVETKVLALTNSAWKSATIALKEGMDPMPGGRPSVVPNVIAAHQEILSYYKAMGLDETSLKGTAEISKVDYEELRAEVDKHFPVKWVTSIEDFKEAIPAGPEIQVLASTAERNYGVLLGFITNVCGANSPSYWLQYGTLLWALQKMQKAAIAVVDVTLKGERKQ